MDKLKLVFILSIGFFTLIYNMINNNLLNLINSTSILILLKGQIETNISDSYIGTLFDWIIGFLFNINIKDIKSIIRLFGG